jgi:hypothetical protein
MLCMTVQSGLLLIRQDLLDEEGVFKTLIEEFGSANQPSNSSQDGDEGNVNAKGKSVQSNKESPDGEQAKGGKLLLDEERNTGSVSWHVYKEYARSFGSWWFLFFIIFTQVMAQASQVGNTLFLGFGLGTPWD